MVVIHADDFSLGDGAFFKVAEVGIEIIFKGTFKIDVVFVPGFHTCHSVLPPNMISP